MSSKNEIVKTDETAKPVENIELVPPVDITEDPDAFTMYFEVPGCNAASVKVEVENGILTVECASTLRRSHRPILFKRIFRLSRAVDISKISAATCDGVLTLTLPKAEHSKPFRVPVA
ncbi:MAG: Hsp20/alpha crystallin family protein [Lentisphaerae bacterium]|nr:Hsp20/alpha crystallin family protein [Lentisphaerota bacterium]